LDQRCVWGREADKRERQSAAFEAVQDPEFASRWGKDQELDNTAHYSIHSEHGTDPATLETKAAAELEGKMRVVFIGDLRWVVEEDGEKLVVGY
jgi:hypothetical protein